MNKMLMEEYSKVTCVKRKEFNIDGITRLLLDQGVDVDNIIHTPSTVVLKMDRKEYTSKGYLNLVHKKYDVKEKCKENMVIFSAK